MAAQLTENPYEHLVTRFYHDRHDSHHHALLGSHHHACLGEVMHYDHAHNAAPLRAVDISCQVHGIKNRTVVALSSVRVQK